MTLNELLNACAEAVSEAARIGDPHEPIEWADVRVTLDGNRYSVGKIVSVLELLDPDLVGGYTSRWDRLD